MPAQTPAQLLRLCSQRYLLALQLVLQDWNSEGECRHCGGYCQIRKLVKEKIEILEAVQRQDRNQNFTKTSYFLSKRT